MNDQLPPLNRKKWNENVLFVLIYYYIDRESYLVVTEFIITSIDSEENKFRGNGDICENGSQP